MLDDALRAQTTHTVIFEEESESGREDSSGSEEEDVVSIRMDGGERQ